MARSYFASALKMKDMTPALRQRTEELIAAIDKKLQPDQFSGYVQSGFRYQTHAPLGPGAQTVLASGKLFKTKFAARPDGNWFGAFGVTYVHDFEDQRGNTFEASAVGYDAQQFKLHQFDIGVVELRAGPRFGIASETANGLSIKPYFVATGATLADAAYYGGLGGGLTMHAKVGEVALDPYAQTLRHRLLDLT